MTREVFFNASVEANVLGCILLDNDLFYQLNEFENDVFYVSKHMKLFEIYKVLAKNKVKIDIVTVSEYISRHNIKEVAITYVTEIMLSVETVVNFKAYISLLDEFYQKRYLDKLIKNLDYTEDAEAIKGHIMSGLNNLTNKTEATTEMKEYMFEYFEGLTDKTDNSIKTGFLKLDKQLRGFNPGELITIGAYSGIGKTTLALDIILRQIRKGYKVSLFTLEIPKEQVVNKLMCNFTNIEFNKIFNKELESKDFDKIAEAVNYFAGKEFQVHEHKSSLEFIISQIRKDKISKNIDIVFIDLINRVTTKEKFGSRAETIGHMTRTLKLLALELEIPIVITAQINKEGEKRLDKRPMLADIKESGSIAEDSDTVIGLYRNREMEKADYRKRMDSEGKLDYNSQDADRNPDRVEVSVLKGRYCGGATFSMKWLPKFQRIEEQY